MDIDAQVARFKEVIQRSYVFFLTHLTKDFTEVELRELLSLLTDLLLAAERVGRGTKHFPVRELGDLQASFLRYLVHRWNRLDRYVTSASFCGAFGLKKMEERMVLFCLFLRISNLLAPHLDLALTLRNFFSPQMANGTFLTPRVTLGNMLMIAFNFCAALDHRKAADLATMVRTLACLFSGQILNPSGAEATRSKELTYQHLVSLACWSFNTMRRLEALLSLEITEPLGSGAEVTFDLNQHPKLKKLFDYFCQNDTPPNRTQLFIDRVYDSFLLPGERLAHRHLHTFHSFDPIIVMDSFSGSNRRDFCSLVISLGVAKIMKDPGRLLTDKCESYRHPRDLYFILCLVTIFAVDFLISTMTNPVNDQYIEECLLFDPPPSILRPSGSVVVYGRHFYVTVNHRLVFTKDNPTLLLEQLTEAFKKEPDYLSHLEVFDKFFGPSK